MSDIPSFFVFTTICTFRDYNRALVLKHLRRDKRQETRDEGQETYVH